MARMLYSTRFYAGLVPGGTSTNLWTCPPGYVDVVVTVVAAPESAGSPDYGHLYIVVTGNPPILASSSQPTRESIVWGGRVVVNAGETVRWAADTRQWKLTVSGYRLTV